MKAYIHIKTPISESIHSYKDTNFYLHA